MVVWESCWSIHMLTMLCVCFRVHTDGGISSCSHDIDCTIHYTSLWVSSSADYACFSNSKLTWLNLHSTPISRLLIVFTANTWHLLNLSLLQKLYAKFQSRSSGSGSYDGYCQHSRPSWTWSPCRVLWYLHPAKWRIVYLQPKCICASRYCLLRWGSFESHLGCSDFQRCCCFPLSHVSNLRFLFRPFSYSPVC